MGLAHLSLLFVLIQLVAQFALVSHCLSSALRAGGEEPGWRTWMQAICISFGSVVAEIWLLEKAGFMVLTVILALPVLILYSYPWDVLRPVRLAVLGCSMTYILLVVDIHGAMQAHMTRKLIAKEEQRRSKVVRYQQVAKQLDEFAGHKPAAPPTPPPVQPVAATNTAQPVITAAGVATNATEPVIAATGVATNVVPPVVPELDTEWQVARSRIVFGGGILLQTGESVAFVNGDVCELGDAVTILHEGILYRWVLREIRPDGVELQQVRARKVQEGPAP